MKMDADLHGRNAIADALLTWFSQNSAQGVLVTDVDLMIVGWSKWLAAATGISAESAIGRPLFEIVPSFVERGFDQYFRQALSGEVKVLSHSFHRFIVPTTGSAQQPTVQSAQSGQIAPLVVDSGIVGTIAIIDDVSDRVASEARLRERIAAAEAASRVKDEFLATLSHEIRTPLNAVLGWTRILRSRSHIDETTLRRAVDVIDRNASAQLTLVSDMLDVARISSGKVRLEMAEVDLGAIVTSAIEAARPAADVKGVRIATHIEPMLPSMSGDADRLLQVIWNLLSNAVKFTEAGGSVTLRLIADGRAVLLTVTDSGQGIEPAFLPHVFERFKQADPSSSRRHGGLGLGLALVKDLVQLHGGTVHVHSAGRDKGATFRVRFPASADQKGAAVASATIGSHTLRGMRILVVEDDPDAAEIAVRTLQDAAATVISASSVAEGLALIGDSSALRPNVIVTDIGLPDHDGYGLLAGVRARLPEEGGTIPVVALTAYASPADRARALRAGFDAHLAKPFNPETLVAVVAQAAGV
jgi:PAS domain S-box-containing protein